MEYITLSNAIFGVKYAIYPVIFEIPALLSTAWRKYPEFNQGYLQKIGAMDGKKRPSYAAHFPAHMFVK